MYRVGNKILRIGNQLPYSANNTVLEFTVRGSSFPDRMGGGVQFGTTGVFSENSMYIDYDDGTGVHEYSFTAATTNFASNSILHYYQNLADPTKVGTVSPTYMEERKIKIWFKFPQRINVLSWLNFGLYGELPKNMQNYNWSTRLIFSNVFNLNNFPSALGGLKAANLRLGNISSVKLNYLPAWIKNSNIQTVTLNDIFQFNGTDAEINGFSGLSNINGLVSLNIGSNNLSTNLEFPVMKDCTTLRSYTIANPFTTLPQRVSDCSQLTTLTISLVNTDWNTSTFNNWGAGIGEMVNLTTLQCVASSNMPTTIPTGMENCIVLKTVIFNGSFLTQVKVDTFVNNMYDFIVLNASTTSGNTKFRQMNINIGVDIPNINPRPTGNYADEDSPMGKIYRMVTIYKHTWRVKNALNNTNQTYS